MEGLADILDRSVQQPKQSSKKNSKRKWREIESIKDKYRLRNELRDIDPATDYDLTDLDF